jgi:hypothetical protein
VNFLDLLRRKKEIYNTFEKVLSPALSCEVFFNSKGFNHITFKNNRNPRTIGDQINRLLIINTAYELIQHSNTFQEYEKIIVAEEKTKEYWGIIAIYKNTKLKVILRKIGNGNVHFWSVIPAHTTSEKRDGNFKMKGDANSD